MYAPPYRIIAIARDAGCPLNVLHFPNGGSPPPGWSLRMRRRTGSGRWTSARRHRPCEKITERRPSRFKPCTASHNFDSGYRGFILDLLRNCCLSRFRSQTFTPSM